MNLQNNLQIANEANEYARSIVKEGSTQLINNTYTPLKRKALYKAIVDLRQSADLTRSEFLLSLATSSTNLLNFYGIIAFCKKYLPGNYGQLVPVLLEYISNYVIESSHVIDCNTIWKFYQLIEDTKKYSLGNCDRLALLALEYMVNTTSDINAEVYRIVGGDHALLVIGRDKNSDPSNVETWGGNAVICDPWANKVYPAKDYRAQLENLYNGFITPNCVEPFTPTHYPLAPIKNYNTEHIKSPVHLKKIDEIFKKKNQCFIDTLNEVIEKLIKISEKLTDKYGYNNKKGNIINKRIDALRVLSDNIAHAEAKLFTGDYLPRKNRLEYILKEDARNYFDTVKFSKEDKTVLCNYNNEYSLTTKLMKFFKIPPTTVKETNVIMEDSCRMLQTRLANAAAA